jgi:hypothetical protein
LKKAVGTNKINEREVAKVRSFYLNSYAYKMVKNQKTNAPAYFTRIVGDEEKKSFYNFGNRSGLSLGKKPSSKPLLR